MSNTNNLCESSMKNDAYFMDKVLVVSRARACKTNKWFMYDFVILLPLCTYMYYSYITMPTLLVHVTFVFNVLCGDLQD